MLIAQISDIHLGYDPDNPREMNARRLRAVIDHLLAMPRRPDLLLATGDLTERGDPASYRRLRAALARLPMPVLYTLGNHDDRTAFRAAFPEIAADEAGFVQYVHETQTLRILMLDTLEEGRHGGGFCADRADWLAARLAEAPHWPTLLVLHHPPLATGIPWLTTDPREPWIARLRAAIEGHAQIVALICGHIHRAMFGDFAGLPVAICPSTAPAVALALEPMTPDRLDDRPMVVEAPPAFALHLWEGGRLVTHIGSAEPKPVIVRYDETMRGIVRKVFDERPGTPDDTVPQ